MVPDEKGMSVLKGGLTFVLKVRSPATKMMIVNTNQYSLVSTESKLESTSYNYFAI